MGFSYTFSTRNEAWQGAVICHKHGKKWHLAQVENIISSHDLILMISFNLVLIRRMISELEEHVAC